MIRRRPRRGDQSMKPSSPTSFAASFALTTLAVALPLATAGCASREYVRGADDPTVDAPAMSTSLDKDDIQRTLQTLLNQLRDAPIMTEWRVHAGQSDRQ